MQGVPHPRTFRKKVLGELVIVFVLNLVHNRSSLFGEIEEKRGVAPTSAPSLDAENIFGDGFGCGKFFGELLKHIKVVINLASLGGKFATQILLAPAKFRGGERASRDGIQECRRRRDLLSLALGFLHGKNIYFLSHPRQPPHHGAYLPRLSPEGVPDGVGGRSRPPVRKDMGSG